MSCPDPQPFDDDAASHPEALIANTLALMSAYAHCSCGNRRRIEGRIVDHLHALSTHPLLSESFRSLAWQLTEQWAQVVRGGAQPDSLFAPAPATVQ